MIEYSTTGLVGVLRIVRPERRNALNASLCEAMRDHLRNLDPGIRSVVITGTEDAFCAGADLAQRHEDHGAVAHGGLDAGGNDSFRPNFDALCDAINEAPVPVIAAIAGPAYGAGMQLAIACDLRVSEPAATFAIPSGKLGVMLSPRNLVRLHRCLGASIARAVLVGGETLDGDRAYQVGFVHRLSENPFSDAMEWAADLAMLAPLSVAGHKEGLLLADAAGLDATSMSRLSELEHRAFASEDLREGLAAFSEKRAPNFRGR